MRPKLLRIVTVPISFKVLLRGQLRFMKKMGFDVMGVSSDGKEVPTVEANEDIVVWRLKMTRVISPLHDIIALIKFIQFCRKEKPLIVHSHTPKAGIIGMLGSWFAHVPIRLHTVAGLPLLEATGLKRRLLNFVEYITYACANYVYPNSQGLYHIILREGFTYKEKLKVIANGSSNGIDTTHFSKEKVSREEISHLRQQLSIDDNDFVYIFVGRLVTDKGINELIVAFESLIVHKKAKLILVGPFESNLTPLLDETMAAIENNPHIISVGFQEDVRPYFAISDCLVFPSYREGFPNVVMQAGAMELPSIVTDINGCNEIIKNGLNGMIIPPKNADALKDAMQEIMKNQALYIHLKHNARPMITTRYEQKVVWNAILNEYDRLLQEKGIERQNV